MAENNKILIIGAGASGLMAAFSAAINNASVTVIDHNAEPGKKLLLTGNGRCNYTNTDVSVKHYHSSSDTEESKKEKDRLIGKLLDSFGFISCTELFKGIGITPNTVNYRFDDTGYIYPKSGGALAVRDALFKACLEHGVSFKFLTKAEDIDIEIYDKDLSGIDADSMHDKRRSVHTAIGDFDSLIIAAGSNAYPLTGSDSSVYPLLKKLGVSFIGFLPALCALYSKDERLKALKGVRTEATVSLITDNALTYTSYGEVQFNEHSISGIPVMQLSGYAARALHQRKDCVLSIDGHDFKIHRTAGFDKAQCCSGGVSLSDIDFDTLRLKHCGNVYVCGELIDIYGDCGGYNLHFAWASGYTAGENAAKENNKTHD